MTTPKQDALRQRKHREALGLRDERITLLEKELASATARQAFLDRVGKPVPRLVPRERSGRRELTACANASDWHVEEKVDPAAIANLNRYDLTIASTRVDRFFQSIRWHILHHRASRLLSVHNLILWLGGDLFSGYIHEELQENNELSPTQAVRWLLPRLAGGIRSLLELDLDIVVPCSFGNHGRTTKERRVSTGHANSYEWLMYHCLADQLRGEKRVRFEITPSGHQYVEVYGRTLHYTHGDELRYFGGVGGLGVPLLKRVPQWDLVKKADVHNIGHFHQLLDFGRAVVNGSLIGYNAYAQSIGASPEPPQQAMYFMDSKRGKCMPTALWVGE